MVVPRTVPNWVGLSISSPNARLIHFFRIFLHPFDITFNVLRKSTSYFGCNPRECFDASYSATRLNAKTVRARAQVMYIARKRDVFDEPLSSDLSYIILQLTPSDESRRLETCDYEPVSRWVVDTLLEAYETREAGAIAEFYRNLSRKSWAATFRDCLFERQVLTYLKTNRNLPIRGLSNPKTTTWTYRGHNGLFTFLDDQTAVDGIKNAVETKTSLHLVPSIPNFP